MLAVTKKKKKKKKKKLSRQTRVCRDKTFVETKMILVVAPANDNLAPLDVEQNVYLLTGKPQISQTTQQITAREDQSVVLRCEASGFPPAVVTWEPSNLLSDPRFQIHGQDLVISDVRLSDSGQIKCKATNALGTSEKTFGIRILREWCVVSAVDIV